MTRAREIAALALVAAGAATQLPLPAWNAGAHYALVRSLADGTPRIDDHLNQSGDIAWVNGHFYAAKSPGLAFLSLPAYAAFAVTDAIPETYETGQGPPGARQVHEKAIWQVNLVVVGAFLALLLLVRSTVDRIVPRRGTAVALMLGLGTMLLPFATSYFSHVVSAALAFAALALLLRARDGLSAPLVGGAGALAGLAVFAELPSAVIAVALGAYVVTGSPRARRLVAYGIGLAAGLVPLLAYNWWAFGSPLRNGYSEAVRELGTTGHDVIGANDEGFFGLTHPRLDALSDILLSGRGLFVLTPIVLVALVGLVPLYRRGLRREALLVGGLTAALLAVNASYYLPLGGASPGPRFLVTLLPFLALPLAAAYDRFPLPTIAVALFSAFWMVSATAAGPLISGASPTTWVRDVVDGRSETGSVLGHGWVGILALLLPVLAAVAVAVDWNRLGSRRET